MFHPHARSIIGHGTASTGQQHEATKLEFIDEPGPQSSAPSKSSPSTRRSGCAIDRRHAGHPRDQRMPRSALCEHGGDAKLRAGSSLELSVADQYRANSRMPLRGTTQRTVSHRERFTGARCSRPRQMTAASRSPLAATATSTRSSTSAGRTTSACRSSARRAPPRCSSASRPDRAAPARSSQLATLPAAALPADNLASSNLASSGRILRGSRATSRCYTGSSSTAGNTSSKRLRSPRSDV